MAWQVRGARAHIGGREDPVEQLSAEDGILKQVEGRRVGERLEQAGGEGTTLSRTHRTDLVYTHRACVSVFILEASFYMACVTDRFCGLSVRAHPHMLSRAGLGERQARSYTQHLS